MLVNDVSRDFRVICAELGMNQVDVANACGVTRQLVSRTMNGGVKTVSSSFETILDCLGYDIEIKYRKKRR